MLLAVNISRTVEQLLELPTVDIFVKAYRVVRAQRVVYEKSVIDGFLLDHIKGVAVLRGERAGEGEEKEDDADRPTLRLRLVWGYQALAPLGLLKEGVSIIFHSSLEKRCPKSRWCPESQRFGGRGFLW